MASERNRENTRPLCVIGLLALAGTFQPLRADPNETTAVLSPGDRFQAVARTGLAQKDPDSVVAYYNKAIADARSNEEKAQLSLTFAGALERTGWTTGQQQWLRQSEQFYIQAMGSTNREVSSKAASNYCAQLVRSNRPQDAVKLMRPVIPKIVNDPALSATAKSRSLYNYGKALELSGDAEAYGTLVQALDADPTFDRAAQAAAGLALKTTEPSVGINRLTGVTGRQLAVARYDDVAANLHTALALESWSHNAAYPDVVRQLVRYLTAAKVAPEVFLKQWQDPLTQLRKRDRLDATSMRMLQQVLAAYGGRLRIQFVPEEAKSTFGAWHRTEDQLLFSELLRMLGDHFSRKQDRKTALAYYSHAWSLCTSNIQAGLSAADILLLDQKAAGSQIDPDGTFLAQFTNFLFVEKGGAYLGSDWNLILKLHIILGTIFESQGRWGPRFAATSAYFQWERAKQVLDRVDANVRSEFQTRVEERFKRARERTQ
jgi:tetratricopeptide (TPR) repeat protein